MIAVGGAPTPATGTDPAPSVKATDSAVSGTAATATATQATQQQQLMYHQQPTNAAANSSGAAAAAVAPKSVVASSRAVDVKHATRPASPLSPSPPPPPPPLPLAYEVTLREFDMTEKEHHTMLMGSNEEKLLMNCSRVYHGHTPLNANADLCPTLTFPSSIPWPIHPSTDPEEVRYTF